MVTVTGQIVVTQRLGDYRIYTEYSAILSYLNFPQVLHLMKHFIFLQTTILFLQLGWSTKWKLSEKKSKIWIVFHFYKENAF